MKLSVMSNAAWMMSEKIISVFGVIFVTSYVAKSFGPTVFGQMAFSTSLFAMVQTVAIFGTETILFKRVSKNASKRPAPDDHRPYDENGAVAGHFGASLNLGLVQHAGKFPGVCTGLICCLGFCHPGHLQRL
ncbi:hypothetical protein LDO48_04040 [Pantoea agglomerans]|nr:hypothetical protein [Pantoea sp. 1B4]MCX2199587.1 hypothetical protein [Pantoea agglomerans]